jgi:hypothetical protein
VHDRVAGGSSEPGVRGPVLFADVGLQFDDPADSAGAFGAISAAGIANEAGPKECRGRLERGPPDERGSLGQRANE